MSLPPKLKEILNNARGITSDSRKASVGYIFFAIRGTKQDGHRFVPEALKKGCISAVVEKPVEGVDEEKLVVVRDTREALGESASLFYGNPSASLRVVGVTGTNGKTTTVHILESILRAEGISAGVIGTVSYRIGDEVLGEGRTTPDQVLWHSTLREMLNKGARFVLAEVSSHALDQKRVWGTQFEAVIFTNLTRDHLDYHGDMESYFRAKERLFTEYRSLFQVVNGEDPFGRRLAKRCPRPVMVGPGGDLRVVEFSTGFEGSRITVDFRGRILRFSSELIGDFQKSNIALAVATALELGVSEDAVREGLLNVRVPGRFEVYRSAKGFMVVVDYAHTPDAMDNVLGTIRKLARGRVITLFGAGGDRDREKRPLMGKAAKKWSDVVILTSDNPRSEDPERIIEDILTAFGGGDRVIKETNRRKAIEMAIGMASEGDIVAVLGKGHEEYQEIGGVKYPFSDREVVKELI
jgi:UDP-N-acetylmuramoyl-L-alanyl-D-glutamate--2,6-diaminopimelate ligase